MKLYVFGNGNLCFDAFLERYRKPLLGAPADAAFIVCDFRGVDTLVMEHLKTVTKAVRVFHIGERPRYLPDRYRTKVSGWTLVGGFEDDAARDAAAIDACTHFLAYDTNAKPDRKSGTQKNIERCLELGKTRLEP